MKRYILVLSIIFIFGFIIRTSLAAGQSGTGEPAFKLTALTTQTAMAKAAEKTPTADPRVVPDRLRLAATPRSSCPDSQLKNMIYDYRPMGPYSERGIVNVAVVIRNNIAYFILAGSPVALGSQGTSVLKQFGMVIVRQQPLDPCAASLAGNTAVPDREYVTQRGPLTATQVEADTVVIDVAGVDVDRFNFITGQFASLKLVSMPTLVPPATPVRPAYP